MFITFEAMDGAGKTTQAKMLADYLIKEGFEVDLTREPGGTPVGEEIRSIIMNNDLNEYAQFFLFQAARFEHIQKRIRPSIEAMKIVICDRFYDSTRVYQSDIPKNLIDMCDQWFSYTPLMTFLLDIPPSLAQERVKNRNVSNVFDNKNYKYHENIRDRFLKLAMENPERFVIIDGSGSPEEVFERITINERLITYLKYHKISMNKNFS